jgi:hypothetical protein
MGRRAGRRWAAYRRMRNYAGGAREEPAGTCGSHGARRSAGGSSQTIESAGVENAQAGWRNGSGPTWHIQQNCAGECVCPQVRGAAWAQITAPTSSRIQKHSPARAFFIDLCSIITGAIPLFDAKPERKASANKTTREPQGRVTGKFGQVSRALFGPSAGGWSGSRHTSRNNPVQAGLATRPEDYAWSSARERRPSAETSLGAADTSVCATEGGMPGLYRRFRVSGRGR